MSAVAPDPWDAFFGLLRRGWRGDFTLDDRRAYRVLLDGYELEELVVGLRRLLHRGQQRRPTAAELLAETRRDPSRPTFEEAFQLIYGRGGILCARPSQSRYADEAERRRLVAEARRARAADVHPLVGAFVSRMGADYLLELETNDPEYGELRRKSLREAWDRHVDAFEGREVAALAAGYVNGSRELGMRKFDPLTALGLERPRELEAAEKPA